MTRASENSRLRGWTDAQALPTVAVVSPANDVNRRGLELPGRLEAYARAPIYARMSGYLKGWKFDIGAKVKAGEVLGDIETPDRSAVDAGARRPRHRAGERKARRADRDRWQTSSRPTRSRARMPTKKSATMRPRRRAAASKANVDRFVAMKGFRASSRRSTACDRAQYRCRRADQCRQLGGTGIVRRLRHAQAARVRERAAELRPARPARHEGGDGRARTPRRNSRRRSKPPRKRSTRVRARR